MLQLILQFLPRAFEVFNQWRRWLPNYKPNSKHEELD